MTTTSTTTTTSLRRGRTPGDLLFSIGLGTFIVLVLFATIYPIYFVAIASVSDPTLVATG